LISKSRKKKVSMTQRMAKKNRKGATESRKRGVKGEWWVRGEKRKGRRWLGEIKTFKLLFQLYDKRSVWGPPHVAWAALS